VLAADPFDHASRDEVIPEMGQRPAAVRFAQLMP
jgi:hypothetical protein